MLSAEKIWVRYGQNEVLGDISLVLGEGEILAILGPNGAGKTTLIRALNGTVVPAKGEIAIDGTPVGKLSRREIAKKIAVVAQETETKFPVTVREFVLAGRFAHGAAFGWETVEDIAIANEVLHECSLAELSERSMNEVSGGERQRAVLARALATEAPTLLLDEPTANLDLRYQVMLFRLVRERCRNGGHSAIVITHDLNLAAEFADSVTLLKCGRAFAAGTPSDVLSEANIVEVFGVRAMLDENPETGNVRVTTLY